MRNGPKILVLWAKKSATNVGIRALAEGAEAICRTAFGPDVVVVHHDHDTPGTPLGKKPILGDIGRRDGAIKHFAREFDAVLDTGSGDSFTNIYGLRRLAVMTYVHRAVLKSGTPLVLLPQTIGPFNGRVAELMGRTSLRQSSRVYARDSASFDYAAQLGRTPALRSVDMVFALPQPEVASGESSAVALNVSGLLWRPNPHVDSGLYRRVMRDVLDLLRVKDQQVVLFPHVLKADSSREDDVTAVEELAADYRGDPLVKVLEPKSLEHIRSELAGAKVVAGARMHACLNALSVGTPAVGIAYSRKFAPLFDDLDWPYYVDLRSDIEDVSELIVTKLLSAVEDRLRLERLRASAIASVGAVANDLMEVVSHGS